MWKSAVGNKTDAKAKMVNDEVVIVPKGYKAIQLHTL